ncbi:MBL fold metallo-hydrolase [Kordiimonas sediminis]|uniref:MBL fold metallo-hydrolase n=1 Tax=Kordiimonas sediminis TaxID=1735581 RepID=A0A919ASH7_9PROT|nr:MBL fold metallo-hydrolase [Kordiimonas sediminis]GHF23250.1 MBL fold metallo-hydrolase [Kordiimonas sediminis]
MALEFVQDLEPVYAEPVALSPLIARVLCENPGPYTYTGTGTYIVGRDEVAVIDAGPLDTKHGEALLKAIGDRTVTHILVTHTHIDHSPLSKWLSEKTGAPTYGFGIHAEGRKGGLAGEKVEAGADTEFTPDHILKDGDSVQGTGWTLKAIHTPGHTSNHLCFHLVEENTVFTGDHIMGWATTVISPPDGDMRDYLRSVEKLISIEADKLLPTHGPAIHKVKPYLRGTIIHRRMREGQILGLLEDGPMTIQDMVDRMYKDVDPRLHGAAARSVLGHIIALKDEERLSSDGPVSLDATYYLTRT